MRIGGRCSWHIHALEHTMGRTILGILAGLVAMSVTITGIEFVGQLIYPPPPGLNPNLPEDLALIMAAAPLAAKAVVVLAWATGAFVGGWVAAKLARRHPRTAAALIAVAVMAGVLGMMVLLPSHPRWMAALGLLLPLPAALLAARLARPRA
jgi:hypothetical protein